MARQFGSGAREGQPTALGATCAAWCGASAGVQATARAREYTASAYLGVQRRRRKRTERTRARGASPACPVRRSAHLRCALPREEGLPSKGRVALAPIIDGPRQRRRHESPGFPCARFFLAAGQGTRPGRIGAQDQRRSVGQGPRARAMPDCFARRAPALARGCLGTRDQAPRGDNILHAGAPSAIVDVIEQPEAENRAATRHSVPQIPGMRIVLLGRWQAGKFPLLVQLVIRPDFAVARHMSG